jgi:NAD-dependent DNA ligase
LSAIEGSKHPELRRFIFSLGIRHVGEATAKQLADQFGDLDHLTQASSKLLALLDGVGDETGLAISQFFEQPNNRKVVADLVGECGIHYVKPIGATQSISFFKLLTSIRGEEPALMKVLGLSPKDSRLRGIGDKSFHLISQQFGTPKLFLDAVERDSTLPEFYRYLAEKMLSGTWGKAIEQVEDFGFQWDSEELTIVDSNPAPLSDKLRRILLSKTDMKEAEINQLTEQDGWALIYSSSTTKPATKDKRYQVCFTGFGNSEKEELGVMADLAKLRVVTSVTKDLQFLVAGEHAGPAKLQKAREQGTRVLNKVEFLAFLETGELG